MTDKQKAGYEKVAKKKNKQYTQEMEVYKQNKEEEAENVKKEEDELLKVLKQEALQLLKKKEKTETIIKVCVPSFCWVSFGICLIGPYFLENKGRGD